MIMPSFIPSYYNYNRTGDINTTYSISTDTMNTQMEANTTIIATLTTTNVNTTEDSENEINKDDNRYLTSLVPCISVCCFVICFNINFGHFVYVVQFV